MLFGVGMAHKLPMQMVIIGVSVRKIHGVGLIDCAHRSPARAIVMYYSMPIWRIDY